MFSSLARLLLVTPVLLIGCRLGYDSSPKAGSEDSSLPNDSSLPSDSAQPSEDSALPTQLCLRVCPTQVFTGSSAQIESCGGVAPYRFTLVSGSATVDADTGLVSVGAEAGAITVTGTDSAGSQATLTLEATHPSSFDNVAFWVRGDELPTMTAGTLVAQWPALVGDIVQQSLTASMPSYQPDIINNQAGLRFDGVDDVLLWPANQVPSLEAAPRAIVAVVINGTAQGSRENIIAGWGDVSTFLEGYGLAFKSNADTSSGGSNHGAYYHCSPSVFPCLSGSTNPSKAATIVAISYDGSMSTVWSQGRPDASHVVNLTTKNASPLSIGGLAGGGSTFRSYQGDIAELVIIDGPVVNTQLSRLQCLLAHKYKIAIRDCESGDVRFASDREKTVRVGAQEQLDAFGGELPYHFAIVNGLGTIDSSTGLYTAPNTTGSALISVTDGNGNMSEVQLRVTSGPIPILHYSAARIQDAINGQPLLQWPDLSGNDRHMRQESSTEQPVFLSDGGLGYPVIRFDGIDDRMRVGGAPVVGNADRTMIVVVARATTLPTEQGIVGYGSSRICGQDFAIGLLQSGTFGGDYRCTELESIQSSSMGPTVLTLRHSSAGAEFFVDGVKSSRSPLVIDTQDREGWAVGKTLGLGYFSGDLAEVVFFDQAISESERLSIEADLMATYVP